MKAVKMSLRRIGLMCLFLIVNFSLCHAQKQEEQREDQHERKWDRSFLTNQIASTNKDIRITTTFKYDMKLHNQTPKTVSNFSVAENKLRDNVLATKEEE